MGDVDAATKIYEVAKQDSREEVARVKDQAEAEKIDSYAEGALDAFQYTRKNTELQEYAVLFRIKKLKEYKRAGKTWRQFCEGKGYDVRTVDRILSDITPLVEAVSDKMSDLSGMSLSKIRYLGRSVSDNLSEISQDGIVVNGETIPIAQEFKEDIEVYIDGLKAAEKDARKAAKKDIEAKERVIKSLHKTIDDQEKTLAGFKKRDPDGISGAEKDQLKGLAELKTQFDLFARSMSPEVNGYLKKAPDTVRTEYGSLIAYGMKVMELLRDRAFDEMKISIFPEGGLGGEWVQPEWVPPEELVQEEPEE